MSYPPQESEPLQSPSHSSGGGVKVGRVPVRAGHNQRETHHHPIAGGLGLRLVAQPQNRNLAKRLTSLTSISMVAFPPSVGPRFAQSASTAA